MSEPMVVIDGIKELIKRDLENHKFELDKAKRELLNFREARSHEIKKKKHYKNLVGGGKYNDESLENSMVDTAINIRHMSDRCDERVEAIAHHQLIVDTLSEQLADQIYLLGQAERYYQEHPEERPNGNSNRL